MIKTSKLIFFKLILFFFGTTNLLLNLLRLLMTKSNSPLNNKSSRSSYRTPFLIIRFAIFSLIKLVKLRSKVLPTKLALSFNFLKRGFFSNLLISKFILPLKFSFRINSFEKILL